MIQGRRNDLRGFTWWGYAAGFSAYLAPNSASPDVVQQAAYCVSGSQNPPCYGPHTTTVPMMNAARSRHPHGGVNAAFCDGSVRFISNNIQITTWQSLSTMQGNEVMSGDF